MERAQCVQFLCDAGELWILLNTTDRKSLNITEVENFAESEKESYNFGKW